MTESIILILIMIGTLALGYLTVNLIVNFFEGDRGRWYRGQARKRKGGFFCRK